MLDAANVFWGASPDGSVHREQADGTMPIATLTPTVLVMTIDALGHF